MSPGGGGANVIATPVFILVAACLNAVVNFNFVLMPSRRLA